MAQAELPVELVNTSAGIDQLLLARIKRMALGTNLYSDVLFSASSLNNLTACALDRRLLIIGVYSFFHSNEHSFRLRTEGILTQAPRKCKSFFVFFNVFTPSLKRDSEQYLSFSKVSLCANPHASNLILLLAHLFERRKCINTVPNASAHQTSEQH